MLLVQERDPRLLFNGNSLECRKVKMIRMFMRYPDMRDIVKACRSHGGFADQGPGFVECVTHEPGIGTDGNRARVDKYGGM